MKALRTAVVLVLALALAACATASTSTPSSAQSIIDGKAPTGLNIIDHYAATYLDKPNHKAFAVATGSIPEQDGFASGPAKLVSTQTANGGGEGQPLAA